MKVSWVADKTQQKNREMNYSITPTLPMDLQSSRNRESFQTFFSSDTATQYPRREVRSEWIVENKLEISALEEHQEAMNHRDNFIPAGSCTQSRRFRYGRVCFGLLAGVFFFAAVAVGVPLGLGESGVGGNNESEDVDDENNGEGEAVLFEETEFEDICAKFVELSNETSRTLFGACFTNGRTALCNEDAAVFGTGLCSQLGAVAGCQCPEGRLIELVPGSEVDLCTVGFSCPLANLSVVTQAPTASPTLEFDATIIPVPTPS